MPKKKALGQHWLKDRLILEAIADSVDIAPNDTVLEIGPGLGTLTSVLLQRAGRVVAVEFDEELAAKLQGQFPGKQLTVTYADFLTYDLEVMGENYVVVANVPYYITQKIIEHIVEAHNRPREMALLVQQEVAEKLAARPGKMTAIAAKAQLMYDIQLGTRVSREYFTPPPQVDSQVVIFKNKHVDKKVYQAYSRISRMIDAGFSAPRKKLRTSLAGALHLPKPDVEELCAQARIDAEWRAQELSAEDWVSLTEQYDRG